MPIVSIGRLLLFGFVFLFAGNPALGSPGKDSSAEQVRLTQIKERITWLNSLTTNEEDQIQKLENSLPFLKQCLNDIAAGDSIISREVELSQDALEAIGEYLKQELPSLAFYGLALLDEEIDRLQGELEHQSQ